ncbi:MAG: TIGR00266 family protein [Bacteroidetes bacterium GWC2_33_15]|nr:MAG: TIGR00266 family protein [Bacteroidetes bacterium GWA2_33_15]OFX49782.1 MAG: TIGR00266 family protein [Bacteroidetes bacterium GWC2_33_15]OFX64973.1 MAG: TIGR00266 family protein [Bacteroidetes bacterium GWB2_32_14]OFX69065.1 MAG: TIGR00266 family protein [Bacteroidetes bacterium GWD2_33_33]HAN18335.1 TIGR00266 family protein [Bacteroidales bacterium]
MTSHEIDYKIIGDDIQLVEIELDPQETVVAEAGAMMFMEDGITFETKLGDGSTPNQGLMSKLLSAGSRLITGESIFMTHFTNRGFGKKKVAFAAPYPGKIIPVDLKQSRGQLIVQKDGFLCAAMGTKISIHFNRKLGAGLVGGEGFILQKLDGDGKAFIHAGGTVIERTLNNETLRIDTGCVVAFEPQIDFDVEAAGSLKSMVFGGEGFFVATLRGTGKIWLQSMPISKLIRRLSIMSPASHKESRSILGNFLEG